MASDVEGRGRGRGRGDRSCGMGKEKGKMGRTMFMGDGIGAAGLSSIGTTATSYMFGST